MLGSVRGVQLGVLSTFDTYPESERGIARDRFAESLGLVRFAESLGIDSFWVTEHHFGTSGTLPSPPIWLAVAAERTCRIRLGALVAVLPLHNPRELAEQYALVDRMSGGRLEIGVGSGYVGYEFWGLTKDPRSRRETMAASLPEFVRALRGDPLDAPGASEGFVRLNVLPLQRPHPPIWRAAGRRSSLQAIGESGDRLALVPYASMTGADELRSWVEEYRRPVGRGAPVRVLVALHVYVGPHIRAATKALQRFLDSRPRVYEQEASMRAGTELRNSDASDLVRSGLAIVGGSRDVRARLEHLRESGVTDVAGIFDFGGLPSAEVRASLARYTEAVGTWVRRSEAPRSGGNVPRLRFTRGSPALEAAATFALVSEPQGPLRSSVPYLR